MSRILGTYGARGLSCIAPTSPTSWPAFALNFRRSTGLFSTADSISRISLTTCFMSTQTSADCSYDVRVATYNVLSSHLAEPSRFPECKPEDLDAPTRLRRVKAKLETEIEQGSVVCLQEVSTLWAGDLHVFFMNKGYAFITAPYGSYRNGYMGVALAWPLEKYEALTVDITRLSETRTWGRAPKPISASAGDSSAAEESPSPEKIERKKAPLSIPIRGLLSTLVVNMKKQRGEEEGTAALENGEERDTRDDDIERVTEPWKLAERRYNQALFARLRVKKRDIAVANDGVFCVGTYHMPCMFMVPSVMTIHTSMAVKHFARLAGEDPLIFAGDFNFTPDSACYKLATQGDLATSSPDFPERPEWEKDWSAATGVPLLSTYKEVQGEEPNFTNHAKVVDCPLFVATLDYLFFTRGITPTKVLPVLHRDEMEKTLPMETEPSDHLLLAAEYKLCRNTLM